MPLIVFSDLGGRPHGSGVTRRLSALAICCLTRWSPRTAVGGAADVIDELGVQRLPEQRAIALLPLGMAAAEPTVNVPKLSSGSPLPSAWAR
ncbi:MAG: hypothetical protein K2Y27_05830 [Xanthobacteraceae bacterium]|nr:hypothetical protein [Xanthobacteraceae bacterium]